MRLPADAVLIVIDAQQATGEPRLGRHGAEAETKIAALIAAWRAEGLPLIHVGQLSRLQAGSPAREGEMVVDRSALSAFVDTALEAGLDELGATTLVMCGALTTNALEASARHAGDLGYKVFVVADACWAVETVDLRGKRWPAQDVHALTLARLHGETATVVDTATTLRAAAAAKARQRYVRGKT
jgi:nicotinamidase-related amidase